MARYSSADIEEYTRRQENYFFLDLWPPARAAVAGHPIRRCLMARGVKASSPWIHRPGQEAASLPTVSFAGTNLGRQAGKNVTNIILDTTKGQRHAGTEHFRNLVHSKHRRFS